VALLTTDVMNGIVEFLPLQTLLHLRRAARQWREGADAFIDEHAGAETLFGPDVEGVVPWSEALWIAAARHVPRFLETHCAHVFESLGHLAQGTPRPGSLVSLVGLEKAKELNGEHACVERWDADTSRWIVHLEDGEEVYVRPENLVPAVQMQHAARRRTTLAVARQLAVDLAFQLQSPEGPPGAEDPGSGALASGAWAGIAGPLLAAMPLAARGLQGPGAGQRLALGPAAVDDYLLALAFLEDGVAEGGERGRQVAAVLLQPGGAAAGAARLLSLLCGSAQVAAVRRALLARTADVPTEAAERAELLRSDVDAAGLRKAIRQGGFHEDHFFTSAGAVASVDEHEDVAELVRLAVRVRRARAVFDHLDRDGDGRLQACELLRFVDLAVPGLLAQQAAKLGLPPHVHRRQYAVRMLQLWHAPGFVADLVHGAYAEDCESVHALVASPPCAAVASAVLHRALAELLAGQGPEAGLPRALAPEAVGCCAELAWAVDLSRSLCLHVSGREVLGPAVAVALRFHGAAFTASPEGLRALRALASPAALAKCASTDYFSERWCNDVPALVAQLLGSGCRPRVGVRAPRRRPTHALEAAEEEA